MYELILYPSTPTTFCNWLHFYAKLWGIAKLPFFTGISSKTFHIEFALWINLWTTQIVLHIVKNTGNQLWFVSFFC